VFVNTAAKVRKHKEAHPDLYCKNMRCLWRTNGKPCPRHEPEVKPYDVTGAIIAYEQGELDEDGCITLFQHLVDTGLAWQLQGHYGRTAAGLIEAGHITRRSA